MPQNSVNTPRTQGGPGFLLVLVGIILVIGPWFIPLSLPIPAVGKLALTGIGLLLLFTGAVLLVVTHLYKRATASLAYVKTGKGGAKACLSGGMLIVPFWHELTWVSLRTVAIPVEKIVSKGNTDAAIRTLEGIPVNLSGTFYVAVENSEAAVLAAAKSLGDLAIDPESFKHLVEAKVDAALRTVCQSNKFEDLNRDKKKFTEDVQKIVNEELQPNGLKLETAALTTFNQAPMDAIVGTGNILDAAAIQIITATTTAADVRVNELNRNAELEKEQKNVETKKSVLTLQLDQKKAENEQQLAVATSKAHTDRETSVAQANAERDTAIALAQADQEKGVAKTKSEQAKQEAITRQQQALKVLQEQAEQAQREAEIAKEQALSVAEQEKLQKIADAKRALADKETARLAQEELRTKAEQGVETAKQVAEADRKKQIAITTQEGVSQQEVVKKNAEADAEAYRVKTVAAAEMDAAQNKATAVTTEAKAKQEAAELEAKGDQARQMVPVNVAKEQVEVKKLEVAVEGTRLKQQTENAQISFTLEVQRLTIAGKRDVGIEFARALAAAYASAEIKMWGTPQQVMSFSNAFTDGQAFGELINSATDAMPKDVRENVVGGTSAVLLAVAKLVKEKLGVEPSPEEVREMLAKHMPPPAPAELPEGVA